MDIASGINQRSTRALWKFRKIAGIPHGKLALEANMNRTFIF